MGYDIQYGQTMEKKNINESHLFKYRKIIAGALVLTAICVAVTWVGTSTWFQDLLIPGDEDVTRAAFNGFVDNIESGTSMIEAVTVFCKEILEGAKLS